LLGRGVQLAERARAGPGAVMGEGSTLTAYSRSGA
jgi:hypothetical protein